MNKEVIGTITILLAGTGLALAQPIRPVPAEPGLGPVPAIAASATPGGDIAPEPPKGPIRAFFARLRKSPEATGPAMPLDQSGQPITVSTPVNHGTQTPGTLTSNSRTVMTPTHAMPATTMNPGPGTALWSEEPPPEARPKTGLRAFFARLRGEKPQPSEVIYYPAQSPAGNKGVVISGGDMK